MRITFRFDNNEYKQYRELNRTVATPRWKIYSLAFLCLVPSFCLILGTSSPIAILAAGTILISVLGLAIIAAIGDKPLADKHDHLLTINQSSFSESQSHSQTDTRWDYYDVFEESDSFYLLGRLDRFTAIPKRSVEDIQVDQLVSYCQQVTPNDTVDPQQQPVALYDKLFPSENQFDVFHFTYQPDDLASALSEGMKVVDFSGKQDSDNQSGSKSFKRQKMLGTFWLLAFCAILIYIITSAPSQTPLAERWTASQIVFLVLAIVSPFLLMKWLNRWIRSKQKQNTAHVPTDPLSMQLMPEGWAIGSPKSCQFFDWRDVKAFYQNNFCFGFHTFNDLVQIIPKRIFADQEESERFLDQAISLRREHLRRFAEVAVAVETGNPYQTPTS